jgi:hypothetical protein
MSRLEPRPEVAAEFSTIAARVWDAQQKDSEKNLKRFVAQLEEQQRLKSELLRAKLRGEVSQSNYEREARSSRARFS